MKSFFSCTLRLTPLTLLGAGLLAATIPISPARANQFDGCIRQMVSSGVENPQAGTACAGALIPLELSQCVEIVRRNIDLPAQDVLNNCYRVRRPVDMAHCVVDINRSLPVEVPKTAQAPKPETPPEETTPPTPPTEKESLPMMVLQSCRQSLLPARYSECVTAVGRDVSKTTPEDALKTCLAAEDFPKDLFPAFADN